MLSHEAQCYGIVAVGHDVLLFCSLTPELSRGAQWQAACEA